MCVLTNGNQLSISPQIQSQGQQLIDDVVAITGLPELEMKQELQLIVDCYGQQTEDLTLDQLRTAIMRYLECLHGEFSGTSISKGEK